MPVCQVRMPGMRMRPSGPIAGEYYAPPFCIIGEYKKNVTQKVYAYSEKESDQRRTHVPTFGIELLSFIPTLLFYCNLHKGERTKVK